MSEYHDGRPTIVVGIDGSDSSSDALYWALRQARVTGARVRAVMSWQIPMSIYLTPTYTEDDYRRDAENLMDTILKEAAAEFGDIPIDKDLVGGRAGPALAHAAEGAELLVIGSHGRGELPGMHLGSVASYCVHHSPCPVVVYRIAASER
jgi:nucleotide-binding universal stress UspA family protein